MAVNVADSRWHNAFWGAWRRAALKSSTAHRRYSRSRLGRNRRRSGGAIKSLAAATGEEGVNLKFAGGNSVNIIGGAIKYPEASRPRKPRDIIATPVSYSWAYAPESLLVAGE